MPNPSQEELLKRSVGEWNLWRMVHPYTIPNLNGSVLGRFDLRGADLKGVDLTFSFLVETDLSNANLRSADLGSAKLSGAKLRGADLSGTNLSVAFAHTGGSVFGVPVGATLIKADLREANLSGADLRGADLSGADLSGATLIKADLSVYYDRRILRRSGSSAGDRATVLKTTLSGADLTGADLREADLREADLTEADLREADLREADLTGADLTGANLRGANLKGVKRGAPPPDTTNWLSLVETVGTNLLVTAATLAAIIQGLDVIERRWREHQAKHQQQGTQTAPPSSQKTPVSDKEIVEVLLVMDDGSHHTSQSWISDPDVLREHIDVFSDPTSKVKPLQVVFRKHKGRALVVEVTEGGKANPQLDFVIRSYLEADPQ